ncbi:MAG: tRNA 2-thiocytidine biosynthesis protein TtcA [Synergistaceae bacterium]|jgi:tRNA(Ile)-lysidine synthase TilS/MesJ|nr:tRNA 2-thiocytidine biosynthesis protein TtcA [Synergistaceae bacterium]
MNRLWLEPLALSLRRSVGRALGDFSMIQEGDKLLLGLSGGKDSLVLLHALSEFRRHSPARFELAACTVALTGMDVSRLEDYCRARQVPYIVLRHPIIEIIENRGERSPCSFCANLRRGMLSSRAREDGFNKLALGHNLDDAVETFFMNLFHAGRAKSFQPKFFQDRTKVEVIRPLIYLRETAIAAEAGRLGLPILVGACPYAGKTERQRTKEMLTELQARVPDLFAHVLNALKNLDSADRWIVEPTRKNKKESEENEKKTEAES